VVNLLFYEGLLKYGLPLDSCKLSDFYKKLVALWGVEGWKSLKFSSLHFWGDEDEGTSRFCCFK